MGEVCRQFGIRLISASRLVNDYCYKQEFQKDAKIYELSTKFREHPSMQNY